MLSKVKLRLMGAILGLFLIAPFLSQAQNFAAFEKAMYIHETDTLPYRILMPLNFNPLQKYPLIIFLHGIRERGTDNEKQLLHGASLFLKDSIRNKYPAIVVFPQCPVNSYWSNVVITKDPASKYYDFNFPKDGAPTRAMAALLGLIDNLREKPYVQKQQLYIGGLSMGGMGTFETLSRKPKLFVAAFAICGGGNVENVKKYAKKVPLWVFHGGKDEDVTPDHSISMVNAIKAAGGNPKFTLYPNDDHNSWDDAFAEPELLPWLLGHKK